ncbi:MAG: hypothetical protein M1812_001165 [Candelaria pacifica]|nr:MAG: hypothetical protein M1812_001165 [Candelaria pacifica]
MPKKRTNTSFTKPHGYVHPSLSPSTTASKASKTTLSSRLAEGKSTSSSVNDLINNSRRNQANITEDDRRAFTAIATAPTVHPSLKEILQVADTPAPRPRKGMRPPMRGIRGGPRGPAGPAPPSSWLNASRHAPEPLREGQHLPERCQPQTVERLPGIEQPEPRSFSHMILKALAVDWTWHVNYDQHYLATLPASLKSLLLAYIAVYGNGTSLEGLQTLFFTEDELEDATGSEDITHLDLSSSVGHSVTFPQLNKYFAVPKEAPSRVANTQESWDDDVIVSQPKILSTARFPHLTHLSLSHPSPRATWSQLMSFMPHMATLTHLSLAYWPWPSQKPKAKTTSVISKNSPGTIDYGASNYYSISDGDLSDAATMLRRLSKATYCLKWLDLEGCSEWLPALTWTSDDEDQASTGPQWNGAWRQIETIIVSQGWVPNTLAMPSGMRKPVHPQMDSMFPISPNQRELMHFEAEKKLVHDERDRLQCRVNLMAWLERERKGRKTATIISKMRAEVGGLRVEFEQGWKGWWIEDALAR